MTSPVDRLATAVPVTGRLVETISPEQWGLPTPCPEWTVRGVVNQYRARSPPVRHRAHWRHPAGGR